MCLNLLGSSVRRPGQATVAFEFGIFNSKTNQWEVCPKSKTVLNLPSSTDILSVGYRDLQIHKPHMESGTGTMSIYVKIHLSIDEDLCTGTSLQKVHSGVLFPRYPERQEAQCSCWDIIESQHHLPP